MQLPVDRISDVTVAILLAAGAGTRFTGAGHKLDATIAGRSVAQHAVAAALDSGVGPLLVVTGANPITLPDGATEVHNPDWAAGQMTSVRRGLDAAQALGATAVVIGLADQPFVTAEAWRAVAASTSPIAVATYDGRRGNPVRLHESVWHLLPAVRRRGCADADPHSTRPRRTDTLRGSPADIDTRRICADGRTNS